MTGPSTKSFQRTKVVVEMGDRERPFVVTCPRHNFYRRYKLRANASAMARAHDVCVHHHVPIPSDWTEFTSAYR